MSRLRVKRQLLDALAERVQFPAPRAWCEQEFDQIWQRIEADRKAGKIDEDDKDKDDETLRRNIAPSRSGGCGSGCCCQRSAGPTA